MRTKFLTQTQIEAGLPGVLTSPGDEGNLELIIIRRKENERELRSEVFLSPDGGIEGDRWLSNSHGKPDPRTQITIMNSRFLKLIAQTKERMPLAGDNLIVDLDISQENLPVGQKLSLGTVLLEVTDKSHTGCRKFAERYGKEALKFINSHERRNLHLRGIYVRILNAGLIRVGENMKKM